MSIEGKKFSHSNNASSQGCGTVTVMCSTRVETGGGGKMIVVVKHSLVLLLKIFYITDDADAAATAVDIT